MELVRAGLASPVGERSIADADDSVESKERKTKGRARGEKQDIVSPDPEKQKGNERQETNE